MCRRIFAAPDEARRRRADGDATHLTNATVSQRRVCNRLMFASMLTALVLALARYPGDGPHASASGRFEVSNRNRDPRSPVGKSHTLIVTERRSSSKRLLLEYPGKVTVVWAPDRDVLAVTNLAGSTQSTVSLFVLEDGASFRKLDVGAALFAAFPNLRGELAPYLHVHLEVIRWRRDGAVECRLVAYAGNGPRVDRRYTVTADGVAKRL